MTSRRGSQQSATLFDYDRKLEQRAALQERMNEVDFWNVRSAAQKVIDEYQQLKAQTEDLKEVIGSFDDAKVAYELAREDKLPAAQ